MSLPGSMVALSQAVDSTVSSATSAVTAVTGSEGGELNIIKNPARAVQSVGGAIMGAMALPLELANTGIALATNAISSVLPPFPAAQLGSMYVGVPHAHAHPPSLVPPASPIPLPSLGAVTLGTCVRVLVGGLPAARCGDLGLAPTCGGLAPFFGIDFGSSKVFIGGTRAARVGVDFCTVCTKVTAGPLRGLSAAMAAVSPMAVIGIAADLTDAAAASDAALAGAKALAAGMNAAQMAADAIALAAAATRGTDPGIPPAMPGAIILGAFTVMIAGIPFPPTPDPAKWLFNKLKGLLAKKKAGGKNGAEKGGGGGCPG